MAAVVEAKIVGVEVDTCGMSQRGFEIFLRDLRREPKTVSMQQLRTAVGHEGPFEELAQSLFLEVKPLIY